MSNVHAFYQVFCFIKLIQLYFLLSYALYFFFFNFSERRMNPRFPEVGAESSGREGPAPRPRVNRTSIVERIGVGQPDVGFIGVDFEVIVVPELNETRRRNASRRSSMKHRFLPRNRSAYVVLDTYPVQMSEDSNGRGFGSQSMNSAAYEELQ
ncbi:hypothetical protein IscW_ISCW009033 [Ixodes scapularis]|uniref:Uncharacterized protein n=1 Tax=Ixodes scapularis TaxID=6945 RepID=B7Q382_IXOSC|nr:hypothetical protein IscW_ISCW009033 [Ixodes scapularis]|eukprot:XP_002411180.1 hypothetical protein IscW_ISCW009033 [Ixodes scapularis]